MRPVYNLAPEPGDVAKLGFNVGQFRYEGDIAVLPAGTPGEYGLKTTFYNATASSIELDDVALTIWGVPANPSNDPLRCAATRVALGRAVALVCLTKRWKRRSLRTRHHAAGGLEAQFRVTSWQHPADGESPPASLMGLGEMVGCDRLGMEPLLTAEVTSDSAVPRRGSISRPRSRRPTRTRGAWRPRR